MARHDCDRAAFVAYAQISEATGATSPGSPPRSRCSRRSRSCTRCRATSEWRTTTAPGRSSTSSAHSDRVRRPFEQYAARLHHAAGGSAVTPIEGGLRAQITGESRDGCTALYSGVDHLGVHVPIDGLGAARFQIRLIDPENVVSFHVYAQTRTGRSIHWRWEREPSVRKIDFTETFTLVPGYPAHQLRLVFGTARPADVTDLYLFVAAKSGTYAGFDLRNLEVARP